MTIVARASQGMRFGAASGVDSPAKGRLPNNGYTLAATGIDTPVVSADGRTVSLHVASMPAKSAVSVNVTGTLDGTGAVMVIDETMQGTLAGCQITPPVTPPVTPR